MEFFQLESENTVPSLSILEYPCKISRLFITLLLMTTQYCTMKPWNGLGMLGICLGYMNPVYSVMSKKYPASCISQTD